MTATTHLTWTEAANDHAEFKAKTKLVAEYTMPGDDAATRFEIVKTNGGRYRLLIAGQKDGADTEGANGVERTKGRAEDALAEALSVLDDVAADLDPQTVEAPAGAVIAEPYLGEETADECDGDEADQWLAAAEQHRLESAREEAAEADLERAADLDNPGDDAGLLRILADEVPVMDEPSEPAEGFTYLTNGSRQRVTRPAPEKRETVEEEIARLRAERIAREAAEDATSWEAALASREKANGGVTVEVDEAFEPAAAPKADPVAADEPAPATVPTPAAPTVKKVTTPKADRKTFNGEPVQPDGWTRIRSGVRTMLSTAPAGRSVEVDTITGKDWYCWVDGVQVAEGGKPKVWNRMKAAKEYGEQAVKASK